MPRARGSQLQHVCQAGEMDVEHVAVKGALHHEVMAKPLGRATVVDFLRNVGEDE